MKRKIMSIIAIAIATLTMSCFAATDAADKEFETIFVKHDSLTASHSYLKKIYNELPDKDRKSNGIPSLFQEVGATSSESNLDNYLFSLKNEDEIWYVKSCEMTMQNKLVPILDSFKSGISFSVDRVSKTLFLVTISENTLLKMENYSVKDCEEQIPIFKNVTTKSIVSLRQGEPAQMVNSEWSLELK
jgi:hypothetical protein